MKYSTVGIKAGNKLYISSKTKEVGFNTEAEYEGTTFYHKELDSIEGVLKNKKLEEGKFGERLKIFVQADENETYVLEIPTINKESLMPWAVEIAKFLPNMELNKPIKISTNTERTDSKGRPYRNFYMESEGESIPWAITLDEIPKPVEKKSKLKGTSTWDFSDRDEFLYNIIKTNSKATSAQVKEEHTPEDYKSSKKKPVESKNDLPF